MDYKEMFEDILEYDKNYVAIIGHGDLVKYGEMVLNSDTLPYIFKDLTEDNFWIIIGRADNKSILEELKQNEFSLDKEGEWEFKILLRYYQGDWSVGESGYYEIVHQEFNFIQTFVERDRENKLSDLLTFDELFK